MKQTKFQKIALFVDLKFQSEQNFAVNAAIRNN
jgi:hypothetical protein